MFQKTGRVLERVQFFVVTLIKGTLLLFPVSFEIFRFARSRVQVKGNIEKSTEGPSWKFTRGARRTVKRRQKFTWLLCPEDFPGETLTPRLTGRRECRPTVISSMWTTAEKFLRDKKKLGKIFPWRY